MIRRSLLTVVAALLALVGLPAILATTASAAPSSGYWMLGQGGTIYEFGAAGKYGPATIASGARAVKIESKVDGTGIWVVDSKGNVSAFGTAVKYSATAPTLIGVETIVTMARTATGNGYWLVSSSGRTFNYGDAIDVGDVTDFTVNNVPLNKPVIDAAKAVDGNGMYLVAEDGGVFTMGDAKFYGSTGNLTLNSPVKSLVPDPDGIGYWLIAGDGGVFSFDAPFRGSMGSTPLNGPVVGMVSFGNGYLQVGSDGGIFTFTDLPFFGSLGGNPPALPIVSVAAFSFDNALPPPSATLSISTASLAASTQGTAYSATIAATGATGAVTWSATGLPSGMSINASTGAITGKPSCLSATTSVTVNAVDSSGSASRALSLTVNALPYQGDFTSGEATAEIKRLTNDAPLGVGYLARASLSSNGCMIAYEDRDGDLASSATVLGALPDTNGLNDIFVLDRGSGVVRRITSGNNFSAMPSLSADGRYLAFNSHATNLQVPTGGTDGVFYVDLVTGVLSRVAPGHASDGTGSNAEVQISADGSHVVYAVNGNTIPTFHPQVYLWNKADGLITQVTHAPVISGLSFPDANGESYNPTVNADGTVVAFASTATNLDGATDNNVTASDVFVWTTNGTNTGRSFAAGNPGPTPLASGTIVRVTNGQAASTWPYLSSNGQRVAFVTYANDIDTTTLGTDSDTTNPGFDGAFTFTGNTCGGVRTCDDQFVNDADVAFSTRPGATWTTGGTVTRVTNGGSGSFLVGMVTNSSLLVFDSHDSTPAVPGSGTLTSLTVFSKDTTTSAAPVQMVPYDTADATNSQQKVKPIISGDGRYVVFASNDSDPSTVNVAGETDNNSANGDQLNRMDFYLLSRSPS